MSHDETATQRLARECDDLTRQLERAVRQIDARTDEIRRTREQRDQLARLLGLTLDADDRGRAAGFLPDTEIRDALLVAAPAYLPPEDDELYDEWVQWMRGDPDQPRGGRIPGGGS